MAVVRAPVTLPIAAQLLARGDDAEVALVEGDVAITYAELRDRVRRRVDELDLPHASVVVLSGRNSIEWVVGYLALLDAGHVPLLAGDHADELADRWAVTAVARAGAGFEVVHRTSPAPELHRELALLMSTSGSTGCPKLVRLSHDNVVANARAIAQYLGLGPDDVGITSLPLHYCYGLSVLHSHLLVGATVVLTDASVVDPCFIDALARCGVTNLAGVPHTFELLERAGPDRIRVPTLRFVTQAGGRLDPDAVVRWSDRLTSWGADLYVMYGQTEATARMAYLPPSLTRAHPDAIGVPIPGGELRVDPLDGADDGVGELVYRGPNVMLGYATSAADLALGRTVDELRTGDLGRFDEVAEVFAVVGRSARFVKPFGVRVDLDAVERELAPVVSAGVAVAGDDDRLVVLAPGADGGRLGRRLGERLGLPARAVAVVTDADIPLTSAGKVDYASVAQLAPPAGTTDPYDPHDVAALFGSVLGRDRVEPTDSFVSLGGDSLSYVECSIRLEALLGDVPADWHHRPIAELEPGRRRRWLPSVDTTVPLRALAICLVVATHMHLWFFPGGAHLLLAVVGYNLSRFVLPIDDLRQRTWAGVRSVLRIAVPTMAWVAAGMVLFGAYSAGTLLLVNNYVGPRSHADDHWHFWFMEVLAHSVLLTIAVLAIPRVRRLERRFPYGFPLAVLAGALIVRMEWAWMGDWYNLRYRTHGIVWFFVLGWLVHRSTTRTKRLATTAIVFAAVIGFFDYPPREWFIASCLVLLLWRREVPVPRPLIAPMTALAAASLWILITHFTVWPVMKEWFVIEVAYVATLVCGVVAWALVRHGPTHVRRAAARLGAGRSASRPVVRTRVPSLRETTL